MRSIVLPLTLVSEILCSIIPDHIQDLFFPVDRVNSGPLLMLGSISGVEGFRIFNMDLSWSNSILSNADAAQPSAQIWISPSAPVYADPLLVPTWNSEETQIQIGFGSPFANLVGNSMLVPTEPESFGSRFRLITSVTNASHYCTDSNIHTSVAVRSELGLPAFRCEISLTNFNANYASDEPLSLSQEGPYSEAVVFDLSATHSTYTLTSAAAELIAQRIRDAGYFISGNNGFEILPSGCSSILDQLPTIRLSFHRDGDYSQHVVIEPRDYVRIDERTGECHVLVDLRQNIRHRNHILGIPFLERFGIFFDYQNRRIGICDPL